MDVVVTIQNTTLYAAGGLGLPTLAILPPAPDWRWLGQKRTSPWHNNVILYPRTNQLDDMGIKEVMLQITEELAKYG